MSVIEIVNAADSAYVPHTSAMLHSLFERNPHESFRIHFLHRRGGVASALLGGLAALCAQHRAEFNPQPVEASQLAGLPIEGRFPEEAWYRVVLHELLPSTSRVLWLDADTIVRAPVRPLWETDLDGCPLAACPNAVMYSFRDVVANIGIGDRRRYFNTGVMLMDLHCLRRNGAGDVLRETAERIRPYNRFADQDVLNAAYSGRYRRLRLAWNTLTQSFINVPETIRVHGKEEFREAMKHPRIVHFTGASHYKPWHYSCSHPYRDEYLRHRQAAGCPPPAYLDRSLRTMIARRLPLRVREIVKAMRQRKYDEMLSFLREW
jgi:lipopolysaccharide biosynthesis glycosyltransferase